MHTARRVRGHMKYTIFHAEVEAARAFLSQMAWGEVAPIPAGSW